jgi:hypothetical protein
MTIRVLLALLALVFFFQAHASAWMVHGVGTESCGVWTKTRTQRPKPVLDIAEQAEWVDGFISAFNFYQATVEDVIQRTDIDGVYAWIDNYCAAHPLDQISTATIELIEELSKLCSLPRSAPLPLS